MTENNLNKRLVALDIGSYAITGLACEITPAGEILILSMISKASAGLINCEVYDLEKLSTVINEILKNLEYEVDFKINSVIISVSSHHLEQKNESGISILKSGKVKNSDIDDAAQMAYSIKLDDSQHILHIVPQSYTVDDLPPTHNPLGLSGRKLHANVHLIMCGKNTVKNIIAAVELNKIKVDRVVFSGLAASYGVIEDAEREKGVCLLNIGHSSVELQIFTAGILRISKVYPFGGQKITSHLEKILTIKEKGQEIKEKYGCATEFPSAPDDKILIQSFGDQRERHITKGEIAKHTSFIYLQTFQYLKKEIDLILSELQENKIDNKIIAGCVLSGGEAQIENILECAKEVLQMPVRLGKPTNRTDCEDIRGLVEKIDSPRFATIFGLIRTELKEYKTKNIHYGSNVDLFSSIAKFAKKSYNWIKTNF